MKMPSTSQLWLSMLALKLGSKPVMGLILGGQSSSGQEAELQLLDKMSLQAEILTNLSSLADLDDHVNDLVERWCKTSATEVADRRKHLTLLKQSKIPELEETAVQESEAAEMSYSKLVTSACGLREQEIGQGLKLVLAGMQQRAHSRNAVHKNINHESDIMAAAMHDDKFVSETKDAQKKHVAKRKSGTKAAAQHDDETDSDTADGDDDDDDDENDETDTDDDYSDKSVGKARDRSQDKDTTSKKMLGKSKSGTPSVEAASFAQEGHDVAAKKELKVSAEKSASEEDSQDDSSDEGDSSDDGPQDQSEDEDASSKKVPSNLKPPTPSVKAASIAQKVPEVAAKKELKFSAEKGANEQDSEDDSSDDDPQDKSEDEDASSKKAAEVATHKDTTVAEEKVTAQLAELKQDVKPKAKVKAGEEDANDDQEQESDEDGETEDDPKNAAAASFFQVMMSSRALDPKKSTKLCRFFQQQGENKAMGGPLEKARIEFNGASAKLEELKLLQLNQTKTLKLQDRVAKFWTGDVQQLVSLIKELDKAHQTWEANTPHLKEVLDRKDIEAAHGHLGKVSTTLKAALAVRQQNIKDKDSKISALQAAVNISKEQRKGLEAVTKEAESKLQKVQEQVDHILSACNEMQKEGGKLLVKGIHYSDAYKAEHHMQ